LQAVSNFMGKTGKGGRPRAGGYIKISEVGLRTKDAFNIRVTREKTEIKPGKKGTGTEVSEKKKE